MSDQFSTEPPNTPAYTSIPSRALDHVAARPLLTINRVLMGAALLIMIGYFLVYTVYAVNLMQFPFDYDQGEGFELVDTIMFSQGQWPYQDTEVYPFYSSNYPPLFHIIAAPFVWLFGPAYWYGRLLGYLSTLVAAAAIGLAVYRDGRNRWIAVLSGLAFLASNTIYHIGPLFRQHMMMVMFETLAVVILAHVNEIEDTGKRRRTLALGLGLIIAAGFTKQLAYATALAAGVFLFIRQPRRAVVWGILCGIIGAGIFWWINQATNGQWWLQTISANVNEFIPTQTTGLFRVWYSLHGFLLVPAVLYAVYELYFNRLSIYTLWFIAATANSILSGKWGAGDSYFATAIAALCILSGLFASRTLNRSWTFYDNIFSRILIRPFQRLAPVLGAIGLIVIPLLYIGYGRAVLHLPTEGAVFGPIAQVLGVEGNTMNGRYYDSAARIVGGFADIGHLTTQDDVDAGWRIVEMVRASDKPVLSEEAAFNLLGGKDVITNPTQLLNLANNRMFVGAALIEMIRNQEFGLIVMRAQFYPPRILEAIGGAYDRVETVPMNGFDYLILRPKPET
jgi:4-amino-4-deoxy-L-arabinose transferase-like glycosyltransferase